MNRQKKFEWDQLSRRQFLKGLVYGAGAGIFGRYLPFVSSELQALESSASDGTYQGPFYLYVHAGGGWDPTLLIDPKGESAMSSNPRINPYLTSDIRQAGNIRYAPFDAYEAFFQKYYPNLIVFNGVETATNNHSTGAQYLASGSIQAGFPCLGAFWAASKLERLALAFVSSGAYSETAGLVAASKIPQSGIFQSLAFPAQESGSNLLASSSMDILQNFELERQSESLAQEKFFLSELKFYYEQRNRQNQLQKLLSLMPTTNVSNPLFNQTRWGLAIFKAGLGMSMQAEIGGFDTHGNHDLNHVPRLVLLVEGIYQTLEEANRLGILDRLVLLVGSDFARTPFYNAQKGKDHWTVTSMMLYSQLLNGNKVIGQSNDGQRALKINPATLALDSNGIVITPAHIHQAIRHWHTLDQSNAQREWPINVANLPFFSI